MFFIYSMMQPVLCRIFRLNFNRRSRLCVSCSSRAPKKKKKDPTKDTTAVLLLLARLRGYQVLVCLRAASSFYFILL